MSDLLPCLYGCGYRPQRGEARELDDTGIFYQFCEVCGATGPTSDSPRGADLAWNRRPSPWVPVVERLPPEDAALVIFRGPDCMDDPHVGSFADGDWYCDRLPCIRGDEADHLVTEEITEWTTPPLPAPPDKED